ncbi:MAG: hypothetical protein AB1428_07250 [Bacteroidota bacterium]
MKNDDVDSMLSKVDVPQPEGIKHQQELKIPLLSYKRSSRAGLWLLALPLTFALTILLKYQLGIFSSFLDILEGAFNAMSGNAVLTYLIPAIFIGLPLFAMIINFLAFCHFASNKETKELLVTIKFRPLNVAIFLLSFAVLVYFFLPDALP